MYRKDVFPRALQYLIAIVKYGSYTRAAEALYVSQPTLSQQIKHLEELLGTSLLDRSGRTIRLTNAGEIYVRHARRAWGELKAGTRAIHDVQNLDRGSLRLGWTPITDHLTCCLLENFNNNYPGITINTLEMPADDIEVAVGEDLIDVGIAFTKPTAIESRSREIEEHVLFEEALCLAIGNAHPRAGQKERMSAQEFRQESLVLLNDNFALRRIIDWYCLESSIVPRISIETDSLSVIIEMVQVSPLATILPKSIIHTQCGLYSIVLAPILPHQAITMIYRKIGYRSPACLAFIELAQNWSARRLRESPTRKRKPCPLSEEFYLHEKSRPQAGSR